MIADARAMEGRSRDRNRMLGSKARRRRIGLEPNSLGLRVGPGLLRGLASR